MKKQNQAVEAESPAYKNLVDLLAILTDATNGLAELENEANAEYMLWVDEQRARYAELQEAIGKAEAALEVVALAHPEWFTKRKTLQTPYGSVKFTTTSKLEIPNEEVSILLIEREVENDQGFPVDNYIVKTKSLSREALEKLDDATLAKFRIKRVTGQNFKVEPARVDMGKAVAEAAKEAA